MKSSSFLFLFCFYSVVQFLFVESVSLPGDLDSKGGVNDTGTSTVPGDKKFNEEPENDEKDATHADMPPHDDSANILANNEDIPPGDDNANNGDLSPKDDPNNTLNDGKLPPVGDAKSEKNVSPIPTSEKVVLTNGIIDKLQNNLKTNQQEPKSVDELVEDQDLQDDQNNAKSDETAGEDKNESVLDLEKKNLDQHKVDSNVKLVDGNLSPSPVDGNVDQVKSGSKVNDEQIDGTNVDGNANSDNTGHGGIQTDKVLDFTNTDEKIAGNDENDGGQGEIQTDKVTDVTNTDEKFAGNDENNVGQGEIQTDKMTDDTKVKNTDEEEIAGNDENNGGQGEIQTDKMTDDTNVKNIDEEIAGNDEKDDGQGEIQTVKVTDVTNTDEKIAENDENYGGQGEIQTDKITGDTNIKNTDGEAVGNYENDGVRPIDQNKQDVTATETEINENNDLPGVVSPKLDKEIATSRVITDTLEDDVLKQYDDASKKQEMEKNIPKKFLSEEFLSNDERFGEELEEEGKSHFFSFLMLLMTATIALYLIYYNRRKVFSLMKPSGSRRTGSRHNNAAYSKLANEESQSLKSYVY